MNRFSLIRRPTLEAAARQIADDPDRRVFRAGGIDLLDRMKEGLDDPDQLVELHAIAGEHGQRMRGITRRDDGGFTIGALVTLAQLADYDGLAPGHAVLQQAAGSAATPGIRNAATVGGNLLQRPRCWYFRHADLVCLKKGGTECFAATGNNRYNAILGGGPSFIVHPSSLGAPLTALQASVEVWRDGKLRSIPLGNLFALPTVDATREHTLQPGEVLVAVVVPPLPDRARSAYEAAKEKQSHDWPLGEAAVAFEVDAGKLTNVRVALGHVAPIPWPAKDAETVLEGQRPSAELFAKAAVAATSKARALEHNAYKVPLVQGLLRTALHRASGLPLPD